MHSTEIGSLAPLYKTLSLLTYLLTKTSGETSRLMHHSRMTQPKARDTRAVPSMSVRVCCRFWQPTISADTSQHDPTTVGRQCWPVCPGSRKWRPTRRPDTGTRHVGRQCRLWDTQANTDADICRIVFAGVGRYELILPDTSRYHPTLSADTGGSCVRALSAPGPEISFTSELIKGFTQILYISYILHIAIQARRWSIRSEGHKPIHWQSCNRIGYITCCAVRNNRACTLIQAHWTS